MRKIYRYEKLSFKGNPEDDVTFKVKFISDGNIGHTVINIPGDNDPEIANSGERSLGKLQTLITEKVVSVSDIANPTPEVDEIIVDYFINDTFLVRHSNPKTETDRPIVILKIKFTTS